MRFLSPINNHPMVSLFLVFATLFLTAIVQRALASDDGDFYIERVIWRADRDLIMVKGSGDRDSLPLTVKDADSGGILGNVTRVRDGSWSFRKRNPETVPCMIIVSGRDGQTAVSGYTSDPPEVCTNVPSEPPVDNPQEPDTTPPEPPVDTPPETVQGSHAGRFTAFDGTGTCLACHEDEAREVHASVHYQWSGDASEAHGLNSDVAGKLGGINDFCIYPDINWIGKLTNTRGELVDGGCAKCHAGLGAKPEPVATREQLENIDCLICHADQYRRTVKQIEAGGPLRFVPDTEKMSVSLLQAAVDITRPSNDSCLNCHTKAGGGDNFKRGDIEEAHRNPTRSFDVHMASQADGGAGLRCLDCHAAASHRIAGRGTDLRPRDLPDAVNCSMCHSDTPHGSSQIDKHTARVNCTVCHIPTFAKVAATDMNRDWSQPGDLVAATGLYEPHHQKGNNVVPEYRFFNGTSYFYQFGDPAEAGANGRVVMSAPLGDIGDAGAKIHAFKKHLATQPVDSVTGALLPLKIGKFFETGQIQTAVELGAIAVNGAYNGHEFADTERYMGLFHEVAPREQALDCNSCHNGGSRLDFAALGYTPRTTRNNRPLCTSCHSDESDEWSQGEFFTKVHDKHVKDKKYDCSACHTFTAAR